MTAEHRTPSATSPVAARENDDAPTLADVVEAADRLWPFGTQESWDASELVAGRPGAPVRRILVAVDPVSSVVEEAIAVGADLLLVHHPLMLGGESSIAADRYKGRLIHDLIENRIGLLACHTNADSAAAGVSEVLIRACGVGASRPIQPLEDDPATGLGRIGPLDAPVTLETLAARLAAVVPPTAQGVRVAGPRDREIRTVAVCGGAGGSLLETVAATEADVYVTADLRHHPVSEAREAAMHAGGGLCLIDLSHAASEWLWVPVGAAALAEELREAGFGTEVLVSTRRTDPWDFHVPSPQPEPQDRWE
ncbi:Nif3-like dinuclear metal center hexameric protein [Kocuria coralli]|uniref:GTP cyclohydrolase 1 type 2 homolog n=1 Tax=Kocuria coralli TaxID=1461025 RepID=A0A5J5KWR1_9MICC|nr:Nif3-like dinuclear metal center hexameric protein [Kocuria coralli]KAA9393241.1 Nif3-like dinuclear metal center hexameric protein [Kocuria coralli]